MKIKTSVIIVVIGSAAPALLPAQEAAQPTVDLSPPKIEDSSAAPTSPPLPNVPELSKLDEVFKQTSLGKSADEFRLRLEMRNLQNEVAHEPAVVAAKRASETARTDLEKREKLRDYYNIYHGRMRARASSGEMKIALDRFRDAHLALLNQPRVRPASDLSGPTPAPPERKHRK